ncbi:hypothetical protein [Nostoc sp. PCC 7524]|nr:hypothetical protein [Nostoc sp. PCC 7524]
MSEISHSELETVKGSWGGVFQVSTLLKILLPLTALFISDIVDAIAIF